LSTCFVVSIYCLRRWPVFRKCADLLDDFLFLDQESTDDTVLDAVGATRTTVGTLDGLGGLGNLSILTRAECRNLAKGRLVSLDKKFANH
jgi:hypothetical protein